ncbi:hypothetical protein [Jannaschia sp. R86511]|uniref:phage holin n=1 Tax=Jannaschia sp. R86511 TaxID=3093853 RepID=UPI0036D3BC9A
MTRLAHWARAEPVRVWLYGVGAAVVALLVTYGLLTPEQSVVWLAVATAVVAVPVGTETLRDRVTPHPRDSS